PFFDDLRALVALSAKDEKIGFVFVDPYDKNKRITRELEPKRGASNMNPVIGVGSLSRLEVVSRRDRKEIKLPYRPDSPAPAARELDLRPGDRVIEATDPKNPKERTPLEKDGQRWYDELARRLMERSGEEFEVVVLRKDKKEPDKPITLSKTGFDFG